MSASQTGRPAGRLIVGGLVVLCAGVFALSGFLHGRALDAARTDAEDRAVAYVNKVLDLSVDARLLSGPVSASEAHDLLADIGSGIRADGVARVRLWSTEGALLFSSDETDEVGARAGAGEAAEIKAASKGSGRVTSSIWWDKVQGDGSQDKAAERLLQTFVPLRIGGGSPSGVAQIDQSYGQVAEQVRQPWQFLQMAAAIGAGVFLVLLVLSILRGRGKPSRPTGSSARSAPDAKALQAKLEVSERARASLEEQLAQLRAQTAEMEARIGPRMKELEDEMRLAQARAHEVESRALQTNQQLAAAETRAVEADARADAAEARATTERATAEAAEARAAILETELASPETAGSAKAQVAELEAELMDVRAEAGRMKQALEAFEALERTGDGSGEVAGPVTAFEAGGHSADVEARLREVEADLSAAILDLDRASERASALDARATDLLLERNEAEAESQSARADAEDLRSKLAMMEGRAREAESRSAEAQARSERPQGAAGDDDDRRGVMGVELQTAQARAAELERDLAVVRAERDSVQAEMESLRGALGEPGATEDEGGASSERQGAEDQRLEEAEQRLTDLQAQLTQATADAASVPDLQARIAELETRSRTEVEAREELEVELSQARAAAELSRIAGTGEPEEQERYELEEQLHAARGHVADLEASVSRLESLIEQSDSRLRRAYAEAENARAELAISLRRDQGAQISESEAPDPETRRLRAELASAIERASAAEERRARTEADLIEVQRRLEDELAKAKVATELAPEDEADGGSGTEDKGSGQRRSLRARLAQSSPQKKGAPADGSMWT